MTVTEDLQDMLRATRGGRTLNERIVAMIVKYLIEVVMIEDVTESDYLSSPPSGDRGGSRVELGASSKLQGARIQHTP